MAPIILLLIVYGYPMQEVPAFESGMSMKEVLTLSGPPSEKKIRESRRIEEWKFSGYTVVFKEGELFSWTGMNSSEAGESLQVISDKMPENTPPVLSGEVKNEEISPEASSIIEEILREVPSGGDSGSSPGGMVQPPTASNPIPPAVVNSGEPEFDEE